MDRDDVLMVRLDRELGLDVQAFSRRNIPRALSLGWKVCCDPKALTPDERSQQIQEIREADVDRWPFRSWKRRR